VESPVDEVDEGGDRYPAQAADVDRVDLAGGEQLVEQASSDAEPARGLLDGQQKAVVGLVGRPGLLGGWVW
jgi:hypothetical protein